MQSEAQFLLALRQGVVEAALLDRLMHDERGRSGATFELALRIDAAELAALPHVAASASGALQPPDAILTIRAREPELPHVAAQCAASLRDCIDPARSTVAAGRRHSILAGTNAVRLFFGLRRLERLTRAEFQDYWLNIHADYGRRLIPPYTYHQVHADGTLTGAVARASGIEPTDYDGIVEVHFPDVSAFVRQLSRPEVAEEALADERNFIDHARSLFWVYRSPEPPVQN